LIEALLERDREQVKRRNEAGETALLRAAYQGHYPAVHVLVMAGSDPSVKDREGLTALDRAARRDIDRSWPTSRTGKSQAPPDEIARWLLSAAMAGDCSLIRKALQLGAPPDGRDPELGVTPLMLASASGRGCALGHLIGGRRQHFRGEPFRQDVPDVRGQ
jgi:ankyrin repeat protein